MPHPVFVALNVNAAHTRLILTKDASGTDFTATTEIASISDSKNPGVLLAAVTEFSKGGKAKRLPVRLVVLRHPDQSFDRFTLTGPDTGTISITLTDAASTTGAPTADPMDIVYVAEPTT